MPKYLFTAEYKDGTLYQQNAEDKSVKEPGKSCYYDIDHDNLVGFVLRGDDHTYGVDLRDGHFEIDGVPFFMHEVNDGIGHHLEKLPNGRNVAFALKDFKLIFFRRHTHKIEVGAMSGTQRQTAHDIVYRVGWQCNVKCNREECPMFETGHNYQEVMQLE